MLTVPIISVGINSSTQNAPHESGKKNASAKRNSALYARENEWIADREVVGAGELIEIETGIETQDRHHDGEGRLIQDGGVRGGEIRIILVVGGEGEVVVVVVLVGDGIGKGVGGGVIRGRYHGVAVEVAVEVDLFPRLDRDRDQDHALYPRRCLRRIIDGEIEIHDNDVHDDGVIVGV